MAFTVSMVAGASTIWGNKLVKVMNITADAASGSVATGLSVVEFSLIKPISCASGAFKARDNLSAASAAALGTIMVSSATAGDNFLLIAVGH